MPITKKELVSNLYKLLKSESNAFKKRAFKKAIDALGSVPDVPDVIESTNDLKSVPGFGKGILERVDNMLNGTYESPDKAYEVLMQVHGIGPKMAQSLVESGIKTIDDLHKNTHKLNDVQKLGLKYLKSTIERIPRKEMVQHNNMIKRICNKFEDVITLDVVGSYRRKKEHSGDIDVLIQVKNEHVFKQIIRHMMDIGYIKEEYFAFGSVKFLGLCKHPKFDSIRRIDLLVIDETEYPYALMYFTGSKEFNIECRSAALQKGYILNEHGLMDRSNKEMVKGLKTERDIMKFLNLAYRVPEKR